VKRFICFIFMFFFFFWGCARGNQIRMARILDNVFLSLGKNRIWKIYNYEYIFFELSAIAGRMFSRRRFSSTHFIIYMQPKRFFKLYYYCYCTSFKPINDIIYSLTALCLYLYTYLFALLQCLYTCWTQALELKKIIYVLYNMMALNCY